MITWEQIYNKKKKKKKDTVSNAGTVALRHRQRF